MPAKCRPAQAAHALPAVASCAPVPAHPAALLVPCWCLLPPPTRLPPPRALPCSPGGAAWDAQSVGVLMQLARALPSLEVELERCSPPGCPPGLPSGEASSAAL